MSSAARYEDLADGLDLDEQARLAGGHDVWFTAPLPERGVPRIKVSDGPVGVRGQSHTTTTSASFPCGSALGASFDPALLARVGAALADEAHTKAVHVLLGPDHQPAPPSARRPELRVVRRGSAADRPAGRGLRRGSSRPGRRRLRQALRGQ